MSHQRYNTYNLICDRCCDISVDFTDTDLPTVRKLAHHAGWRRLEKKDYCPDCAIYRKSLDKRDINLSPFTQVKRMGP